jgi:hypothetical protein
MHHDPQQHLDRLRRLLPSGRTLELIILKGHLILEEYLDLYLAGKCRRPAPLQKARLSFVQKVNLFQALFGWADDDPHFRFLVQLNRLRNRLAHTLEPGDLNAAVDHVLRSLDEPVPAGVTAISRRRRAAWLRNAIFLLAGIILGMSSAEVAVLRGHGGAV